MKSKIRYMTGPPFPTFSIALNDKKESKFNFIQICKNPLIKYSLKRVNLKKYLDLQNAYSFKFPKKQHS